MCQASWKPLHFLSLTCHILIQDQACFIANIKDQEIGRSQFLSFQKHDITHFNFTPTNHIINKHLLGFSLHRSEHMRKLLASDTLSSFISIPWSRLRCGRPVFNGLPIEMTPHLPKDCTLSIVNVLILN